jgi:hypothetical protein
MNVEITINSARHRLVAVKRSPFGRAPGRDCPRCSVRKYCHRVPPGYAPHAICAAFAEPRDGFLEFRRVKEEEAK